MDLNQSASLYKLESMSAFSQAMLDQLQNPEIDVTYRMVELQSGAGMDCSCRDFIALREEEKQMVGTCTVPNGCLKLLDLGCGIGRHSKYVCEISPKTEVTLLEQDDELLTRALEDIPSARGYHGWWEIPPEDQFDAVLLLGNGLGLFGDEESASQGLGDVCKRLVRGGSLLIESGGLFGAGYSTGVFQIEYRGLVDGPFNWGFATRDWTESCLKTLGMEVRQVARSSRPGGFFIIHAQTT